MFLHFQEAADTEFTTAEDDERTQRILEMSSDFVRSVIERSSAEYRRKSQELTRISSSQEGSFINGGGGYHQQDQFAADDDEMMPTAHPESTSLVSKETDKLTREEAVNDFAPEEVSASEKIPPSTQEAEIAVDDFTEEVKLDTADDSCADVPAESTFNDEAAQNDVIVDEVFPNDVITNQDNLDSFFASEEDLLRREASDIVPPLDLPKSAEDENCEHRKPVVMVKHLHELSPRNSVIDWGDKNFLFQKTHLFILQINTGFVLQQEVHTIDVSTKRSAVKRRALVRIPDVGVKF